MLTRRLAGMFLLASALVGCGDDDSHASGGGGSGGAAGPGGAGGAGGADSGVQVPGLSAPVDAHFDPHGVLTLNCQTNEDCFATLGYFHARDRFVQMDLRRRITTGRLSQMLAAGVTAISLPIDVENRARYSTRLGDPLEEAIYAQTDDESKALMVAYARGVNAWIGDVREGKNGAQFPREYQNETLFDYDPSRIPEWQPTDSVATIMALINSLTNRATVEIDRGRQRTSLRERFGDAQGELMFRDLFDTRPDIDSPILPGFGVANASLSWTGECRPSGNPQLSPRSAEGEEASKGLLALLGGDPETQSGIGSNNWVVNPERSASGNTLLGSDPHLGMTNPALLYLAHLDSKTHGTGDVHVAGLTFAGLPFFILGQNEQIAWGNTNSNFDLTDVYVEEVSPDGTTVTFQGAQVPIIKKTVSFALADGSTTERELSFVPHHGPVLPQKNPTDPMMTLRWTGNDLSTDVSFLMRLAKANDVYEARSALESITGVGSNWVVADAQGNTAYFPYNRVPKRPWATSLSPAMGQEAAPWLPLDGRGDFEWESYYEYSELPQIINPPLGYVATANNDMTGALFDGDPTNETVGVFQTAVEPGYRHKRIVDLLQARTDHDTASMDAIISDTYSLIGQELTPLLLATANGLTLSANGQKVVNALQQWSFQCPTGLSGIDAATAPLATDVAVLREAAGCAAFHVLLRDMHDATVQDEGIPIERGPNLVFVKLLRGEPNLAGDLYWDDTTTPAVETKNDIVTAAFDSAGTFLVTTLGSDETQWAWGRIHSLTMRSDVDTASSGAVKAFNESGFANDGGLFTVDVANPTADFTQNEGAATRFVCEVFAAGPQCTVQLPGGQAAHLESVNYIDMLPGYLANTPLPLQMSVDAAKAEAVVTVVVTAP